MLGLVLLYFLVHTQAICRANDKGIGSYTIPCELPYILDGKLYNGCISTSTSGTNLWCPTETNSSHYPVPGRWGWCLCENICPSRQDIQAVAGTINTSPPDTKNYSALNCTWHVVNPDYETQRVPTTIFFATSYFIKEADIVVRDTNDRNQLMAIKAHQDFTWTTQKEFWVHMTTPHAGNSLEAFHGAYYSGFCSDVDGEMELPTYDFQISSDPFIPLVTDKYYVPANDSTPVNNTEMLYRANAYCNWIVPVYDRSFTYKLRTLNFYKFDLGKGDVLDIFIENNLNSLVKAYSFTADNPPVPVTSNKKMKISFRTDKASEGTGFQADIFRESCSPRTVQITAPYGMITDGSTPIAPYPPAASCTWLISRGERETITVTFDRFALYQTDVLTFFEGTGIDGKPLGIFTGNQTTTGMVITATKNLFISFNTQKRSFNWAGVHGFSLTWRVCAGKCLGCQPGTFWDFETSSCRPCPVWTVALKTGSTACIRCANGTKWISPAKCESCEPGTSSQDGKACEECPIGTVAQYPGMPVCVRCNNQTYAMNGTMCSACPKGQMANDTGNGCKDIPVPEVPKNNAVVLIYCGVGVGVLIIIGASIAFFQWKKSQGQSYSYQPLPAF